MNKLEGYELITKENKDLKAKIEILERENRELRKSVNLLSSLIKNSNNESSLSPSLIVSDDSRSDVSDCEVSSTASNTHSQSHRSSDYICQSSVKIRDSAIHCAKFSNCGKFIGVGSSDHIITFFECNNRIQTKSLNQLIGHDHIISDLIWDNSSTSLFSCSYDHTVKIWDISSKSMINSIKLKSALNSIILDPNNNNVVYTCGSDKLITGIDKRSPKIIFQLSNDSVLTSIKPTNEDYTYVTGDMKGMLKFWDVRGQLLKKELTTKTSCSAISSIGIIFNENENEEDNKNKNKNSSSSSSSGSSNDNLNNNDNIIITNHYNGSSNIYKYNISNDINKSSFINHSYTIKPGQSLIGYQTKCAISQRINNNNNNNTTTNNNLNTISNIINNNNNNNNSGINGVSSGVSNKDNLIDNISEDSDTSDNHHIYDKNVAITGNDGSITMYSYIPNSESNNNNNNNNNHSQLYNHVNNNNNLTSSQQQLLHQEQSMILSHAVKIECHKRPVTCVDFHPVSNNTFLTGSLDSHIKIWYKSI